MSTNKPTPRLPTVSVELPDDVLAFLKERRSALGASYKGTLAAAVRAYRAALEAKAAGKEDVAAIAINALAGEMTKAALAEARQPAPAPDSIAGRVAAAKHSGRRAAIQRKGTARAKARKAADGQPQA